MSQVTGYIVILDKSRYFSLHVNFYYEFSEPVPEFEHSRSLPLICFITNEERNITHIGLGTRGLRAGTDLRKLNIKDIFELNNPVSALKIANLSTSKVRSNLIYKSHKGGLLSPKSFEEFLRIFLKEAVEAVPILEKYTEERSFRIQKLPASVKTSLAEQKEAVLTAMNIAGIDRGDIVGWDYDEKKGPSSYLDGISHATLREDSMIINDLSNFPGFDLIKSTKYSASIFKNDRTQLTVLLANRQPLEELLGTDLIYYNENFKCFVLVQYKVMEKECDTFKFRLPNKQFSDEIKRMDSIYDSIKDTASNEVADDYRICENPFFIKICPRLEFKPDNVGLSSGMYIPLDYIKKLEKDKCIMGKSGGKAICFENVRRYFDNTGFKTIIEGGWIGTNPNQSLLIERIIKDILENGKTAVIAIDKELGLGRYPRRQSVRKTKK